MRSAFIVSLILGTLTAFATGEIEFRAVPGSSPRIETLCGNQRFCRFQVQERRWNRDAPETVPSWVPSREPVACLMRGNSCPSFEVCINAAISENDILRDSAGDRCLGGRRNRDHDFN
jgi:hypothetical protein